MRYLIGLDNGGTLTKAVLFDENLKALAKSSRSIALKTERPLCVERDSEEVWQKNAAAIRELIEKSGIDPADIAAISFSGHGKGMYFIDQAGAAKPDSILSTDRRAIEEVEELKRSGAAEAIRGRSYQNPVASQVLSLLLWHQKHRPELCASLRWIFGVKDYLRYRLTGRAHAEITDFSGSNIVDLNTGDYDRATFRSLGLEDWLPKLPPLVASTFVCGQVSPEAAALTGLPESCQVVAGLFDIDACAISMNVCDEEHIAMIGGTWSINEYVSPRPISGSETVKSSYYCIEGLYLAEESSPTSASNNEWFINAVLGEKRRELEAAGRSIYEYVNAAVAAAPFKPEGALFFPYLFGGNYNERAKASFIGLDVADGLGDLLRAVYEGTVFGHRIHVDALKAHKQKPFAAIRLAGGIAKSPVWVQMVADVFNLPVEIVDEEEQGCLGAAMVAAVGAGLSPSLAELAAEKIHVRARVLPDAAMHRAYDLKFARFARFAAALDPEW